MSFEGRVRNGLIWERVVLWKPPLTGYCGRSAPKQSGRSTINQGEVLQRWTSEKVVQEWVKSLRAQGQPYEVVDDGASTVVRSLA